MSTDRHAFLMSATRRQIDDRGLQPPRTRWSLLHRVLHPGRVISHESHFPPGAEPRCRPVGSGFRANLRRCQGPPPTMLLRDAAPHRRAGAVDRLARSYGIGPGGAWRRAGHEQRRAAVKSAHDRSSLAAQRIKRCCVFAFLTAASGMPASKVTSLPSC